MIYLLSLRLPAAVLDPAPNQGTIGCIGIKRMESVRSCHFYLLQSAAVFTMNVSDTSFCNEKLFYPFDFVDNLMMMGESKVKNNLSLHKKNQDHYLCHDRLSEKGGSFPSIPQ
jgi:hypothetical protein